MNRIRRQALGLVGLLGAGCSMADEVGSNSLANVDKVLQRVLERAKAEGKNDREFRAHYAFIRNKVTEHRNSKGNLKKREERRVQNDPKPPVQPLPLAGAHTDGAQEGQIPPREPRPDASDDVKGKAFEKTDFPFTDDLLKRFRFTLVRREVVNGRSAFMMDFEPASDDLPVRSFKDRFINKAAGRVWVDEAEGALVKADLHLTEAVNVIGGLVGSVRQCKYGCQRERTPEGLWFTTQVNWHLEGRQVFFNKTIDYRETRENLRKVW